MTTKTNPGPTQEGIEIDSRIGAAATKAPAASREDSHPQAILKFHHPNSLDYKVCRELPYRKRTASFSNKTMVTVSPLGYLIFNYEPFQNSFVILIIKSFNSQADDYAQMIYYSTFIVVFQFGWASTQISHLAAIPDLSECQNERTGLTAIRFAMTVISTILVRRI